MSFIFATRSFFAPIDWETRLVRASSVLSTPSSAESAALNRLANFFSNWTSFNSDSEGMRRGMRWCLTFHFALNMIQLIALNRFSWHIRFPLDPCFPYGNFSFIPAGILLYVRLQLRGSKHFRRNGESVKTWTGIQSGMQV